MRSKNMLCNMIFVLKYYIKFVPTLFFGELLFTVLVSAVWAIQGPVTTKYMLDALIHGKSFKDVLIFLAGVTFIGFVRQAYACYIVEYLRTVADVTMKEKLLRELYQKAVRLDLEYYETPQFYTDYVWAAQQATDQFRKIYNSFVVIVARLSETVFLGGLMVVLDPVLLLLALGVGIIRFVAQKKKISYRYEASMKAKPAERERDYAKRVFYLCDYAKELRMSRIHEVIYRRFDNANAKLYGIWNKFGIKSFKISIVSTFGTEGLGIFGMYAYLAYGAMVSQSITIGDLGALSQSVGRFSNRLRQFLMAVMEFAEQSIYIDKFRSFMRYEPKIEQQEGDSPEKELQPLVLKNLSFTYHGEKQPSLKDINMIIKPHEKIALVGYNGAGKTTLIKLLMRLYDPSEGEILLGNKNIKKFGVKEYRKEFAAVFQDYQIFAVTLGENVVMDNVKSGEEKKIIDALYHSGFSEKLNILPRGLATPVTKEFEINGENLSGGEQQKVAIARAFYRNSHFVLMDEPSSALDPIAEFHLNRNMMEIAKDRTVIFISHRLSTTVLADRIYMFEKGRIIEQGTHSELMAYNGKYAEMFKKQASSYQ